mmetsp:Transcript_23679/g.50189  ORF Transcript_23679/g.50189 Transcript_23679/m.50189 type:complete len:97 (+) Transcript_23679:93-383(+)
MPLGDPSPPQAYTQTLAVLESHRFFGGGERERERKGDRTKDAHLCVLRTCKIYILQAHTCLHHSLSVHPSTSAKKKSHIYSIFALFLPFLLTRIPK